MMASKQQQLLQTARGYLNNGHPEQAKIIVDRLLLQTPIQQGTLEISAETERQLGNLDCAEHQARAALKHNSDNVVGLSTLGVILHMQGKTNEARIALKNSLKLYPQYAEAQCELGFLSHQQGKHNAGRALARSALKINHTLPGAYLHRGSQLMVRRLFVAARRDYEMAIFLKPDYWQGYFNAGVLARTEGFQDSARAYLERAYQFQPNSLAVIALLISSLLGLGDISAVLALRERVVANMKRLISDATAHDIASMLFLAPYLSLHADDVRAMEAKANAQMSVDVSFFRPNMQASKKIRIGYLSGEFGDHPISHVTRGIFSEHDREKFEVIVYALTARDREADLEYIDAIRHSCDAYVNLASMTTEQIAQRISADEVAILINLSGYMAPVSLSICALRPAPVQAYWLGHGGGLGLSFIDYVIADEKVINFGESDMYVEKIVRLPECYHCADTPVVSDMPQSREMYGLNEESIVFCAFNNLIKIDNEVFDVWMTILQRVPNSQLWLSKPSGSKAAEENLRREASKRQVDPDRLVFATRVEDKSIHFARHRLADLYLDSFCYTAATTALDALWAGLPVLTRPGATFYSRICGTMVQNAGLEEMICTDNADYVERAVYLANHPVLLGQLRVKLENKIATAPLFDVPRFVRHLEDAYTQMWMRYQSGLPPCDISVDKHPQHN